METDRLSVIVLFLSLSHLLYQLQLSLHWLSSNQCSFSLLLGDTFRLMVDEFLRRGLRKGVPSLFVNLRPLYADKAKVKCIEELILTYHENLSSRQLFLPEG